MGVNKEREDFEAEFSKIKSDIAFWLHTWDEEMQGYNHPVMCWFWYMWQAAKAQAVPKGFVLVNVESLALHAQSIRMFNNSDEEDDYYEIENHVTCTATLCENWKQL